MRKGTPEQLMDELNKKIDELKGSPNSATKITCSDYYEDVDGTLTGECGTKLSEQEVESLFQELKRMKDPVVEKYRYYESWLSDTVDNGYLREVRYEDLDSSSRVIVDDEEDVIVAGEDIEDVVDEVVEDTPEAIDVEVVEDDKADYLTGMYASVEKELRDLTESVAWDSDEDSIYLDVNFADGHVFTFTIPKADLAYDLEDPDKDIEYICNAVRDAGGAEAPEDEYYDDYSDDDDEAVYL